MAVPAKETFPNAMNLSDLTSAGYTPGSGVCERVDPFWLGLWPDSGGGVEVSWRSIKSVNRLNDLGVTKSLERECRWTPEEAMAKIGELHTRPKVLAAINMWLYATSEQLAAITGKPSLLAQSSDTDVLWAADLIQRGRFFDGRAAVPSLPEVYRISSGMADVDLSGLNYRDWLGVTAGHPSNWSHQFTRHNLLTTELSLRVAEFCPTIAAVLGENVAAWSLLFPAELKPNPHREADALWVRSDGMKIAVEMTATATSIAVKARQMADLLAADETKSLTVLYVVAAHPDGGRTTTIAKEVRQEVMRAAYATHEHRIAGVAQRMAVVLWKDWFPAPGLADPGFLALSARRPSGKDPENRWEPVDLADSSDLPIPASNDEASARLLTNVNDLYGIPHWQRHEGEGADLDNYLIDAAGLPDQFKQPESHKRRISERQSRIRKLRGPNKGGDR
jgi:hypothetical protein